jgi:hypothetical protein
LTCSGGQKSIQLLNLSPHEIAREARTLVLRNALEQHYDDLRNCAERLNSQISGLDSMPMNWLIHCTFR